MNALAREEIRIFYQARYLPVRNYGGRRIEFSFNTVREGGAFLEEASYQNKAETMLRTDNHVAGFIRYYVWFGIFKGSEDVTWIVLKHLERIGHVGT